MQKNTILSLPTSSPTPSRSLTASPTARSYGTVEDFTFDEDETSPQSPSCKALSDKFVISPKKLSEELTPPLPPQVDINPTQEATKFRSDTLCSKRSRYSTTVSDFVEEFLPSIAFHKNESGEFDFRYQADWRFSATVLNSSEKQVFKITDVRPLEDEDPLEKLRLRDFNIQGLKQPPKSNRRTSINLKRILRKTLISLEEEETVVTVEKQSPDYDNDFGSVDIIISDQPDAGDDELLAPPEDPETLLCEPLNEKNHLNSGTNFTTRSISFPQTILVHSDEESSNENNVQGNKYRAIVKKNSICKPIRKSKSFRQASKVYKLALISARHDVKLSSYSKKTILNLHNVKMNSLIMSKDNVSIMRPQILRFCSPCTPEDDEQESKTCILM